MKIYGVMEDFGGQFDIDKYFACKNDALDYIASKGGDLEYLDDWLVELELQVASKEEN